MSTITITTQLGGAESHLTKQSKALVEAQARVDELLKVQQRLRIVLGGEGDNGLGAPSRSSLVSVAEATDGATAAASGPLTSARLAGLRQLIGKAVRTQAEQQHEIDRLTEQLREERTASGTAALRSSTAAADADALRERVATLEAQLADERRERMESESAAMEREERLEERVEELLEQERHRIEAMEAVHRRQKAMEAMEAVEPPPAIAAAPIAVAAPPPPPPAAGFDASAGGFSL